MRNDAGLGRFAPSGDDVAVIGFTALLYLEHLIFGANRIDVAMCFAIIHLVLLLLVLSAPSGRRALQGAPLAWVAAPFAFVLAGAMFTTLPMGGSLGHPLWTYVSQARGSISLDPAATRAEMVKLAGLAAVFALTIVIGAKRERAETFVRALSYVGGAYAAWAFLSWSSDPNTVFGVARSFGAGRLTGSFLSANSAATLFACQCLLQLCLIFRAVRRAPKPFFSTRAWSEMKGLPTALILLFLNASCLVLTASRGGAVALAAAAALAIAAFALIRTNERSASGGVVAVGAVLAFGAATLVLTSGGTLLGRLADNPVTNDRAVIFSAYWRSILASPWWGYGLGSFYADNFQAMTAENAIAMGSLGAAHNVYLQWLLQTGVAGLAPMMICVAVILATILAAFRRRSRQQAFMIFALATAALFAIHGITDFALEEPSLAAYFTAVLGLGYGVATRA